MKYLLHMKKLFTNIIFSLKPKQHFHFFLITVKGPKWMDPWIHWKRVQNEVLKKYKIRVVKGWQKQKATLKPKAKTIIHPFLYVFAQSKSTKIV